MILSVSRRTDIPACYASWFYNRLKAGYVYVRNPMRFHQISKIALTPEVIDGIVFWTKDPRPMLKRLDALRRYSYYFQCTLTPYGRDVELNLPDKSGVLLPALQQLAQKIGPERVIWRYDPIFLTAKYSAAYHLHAFDAIARRLFGYTHRCVISFLDDYRNTQARMRGLGLLPLTEAQMRALAEQLSEIARHNHMEMESCAEAIDLSDCGIAHGHCIDRTLLEKLTGCPLDLPKDKNQRPACGCAESIDIGLYDTCQNGCLYCYATHSPAAAARHAAAHDPDSPLLFGTLLPGDMVHERPIASCKSGQLHF